MYDNEYSHEDELNDVKKFTCWAAIAALLLVITGLVAVKTHSAFDTISTLFMLIAIPLIGRRIETRGFGY